MSRFGVNHLLQGKTSGTTQELGQPTANSSILGDDIQILPHVWWRIHPYLFVKPKYCLLKTDFLLANIYIVPLSEHVSASHIHDVFIVHSILCVHYIYMLHYCVYIHTYIYMHTYKYNIYIAYIYIYNYVYICVLCNIHHFARWLQFSGERLASSSSLSSFRAL